MRNTEFTDKLGYTQPFIETIENMSMELQVALWDALELFMEPEAAGFGYPSYKYPSFMKALWRFWSYTNDAFRDYRPIDMKRVIKKNFFELSGGEVYNLLHCLSQSIPEEAMLLTHQGNLPQKALLIFSLNDVLEEKQAACRFVNDILTPLSDKIEIETVEQALDCELQNVKTHIQQATIKLKDKDYKNCVHQAVCAIESFARITLNEPKPTLGGLIDKLCEKLGLDKSFSKLLHMLWGISSNNARHSEDSAHMEINESEAKFFLVTCSSIINYMLLKVPEIQISN